MEEANDKKIVWIPVSEIQRPKKNPNKMTEFMFHSLVEGIKQDGFIQPVVLREEDKRIIDGDHRFMAGVEAGYKTIPCIILNVTEEQGIKIGVALNQKKGYFDYVELKDLLAEVTTGQDLNVLSMQLGFTDIELTRLLQDSTFDNEKVLKEKLLEAGVDPSKIDAMADVGRTGTFQDLPESIIKGRQEKLRYPIVFFFNNEEDFKTVDAYFKTPGIREPDGDKLVLMVKSMPPVEVEVTEEIKKDA